MTRMASFWLLTGSLCSLMYMLVVQGKSWTECLDKDEIITEMSSDVDSPSACVLTCTVLTYRQILNAQQKLTVRFRDSESGEAGEFCWFIQTRCGSSWDEVFVLLPVNETLLNEEQVQIHISSATHTDPILLHTAASTLPDNCGLRFDVTSQLTQQQQQQQTLCVRLTKILENTLQCPPFLAIIRNKHKNSASLT